MPRQLAHIKTILKSFSSATTVNDSVTSVQGGLAWGRKSSQKKVSWNTDVVCGEKPVGQEMMVEELDETPLSTATANSGPNKLLDFLYIGDHVDGSNLELLKSLNITHILNLTSGKTYQYPIEIKVDKEFRRL